jgi:hypothetical protein
MIQPPSPWCQDLVASYFGLTASGGVQKVSPDQMKHGFLHASLRKPRSLGKLRVTETRRPLFRRGRQSKVDQKGRRSAIMSHEVAHERVDYICIQGIPLAAHRQQTYHVGPSPQPVSQ